MQKIGEIMDTLPEDVFEKLPFPPGFDKLPADVLDKLKAIRKDKSISIEQRFKDFQKVIEALPEDQKALIRPPPA